MLLSRKNPHPFDSRLGFDFNGHSYTLDGSSANMISCTTLKGLFFNKFIPDEAIEKIMNSSKYLTDVDYKYYMKTSEDIKKEWSESNRLGTCLHNDIEKFLNGLEVTNTSKEYAFFQSFLQENSDLQPYRTEWSIFSELLRISGTIDAVFRNTKGEFILMDWKRSVVTYDEFDNAKFPIEHLKDNKFIQYSIQLNLYRQILEDFYGIRIKDMFIVELHPDNDSYKMIQSPRLEDELKNLFAFRADVLRKMGYTTSELNQYVMNKKAPDASKPINKGKRWSTEEDKQILLFLQEGKSISELSVIHGRSESAIKLRILRHASLLLQTKSKEDVCEHFKINQEELDKFLQSQIKESKSKDPKTKLCDVLEELKYDPSTSPSSSSSGEKIIEEIRPLKKKRNLSFLQRNRISVSK